MKLENFTLENAAIISFMNLSVTLANILKFYW